MSPRSNRKTSTWSAVNLKNHVTSMSCKLEPAIWPRDTGQRILCFDRCRFVDFFRHVACDCTVYLEFFVLLYFFFAKFMFEISFDDTRPTPIYKIIMNLRLLFSQDIEECQTNADNCHVDANCTNTKGSFFCTCHTGYSGNGVTCVGEELRKYSSDACSRSTCHICRPFGQSTCIDNKFSYDFLTNKRS